MATAGSDDFLISGVKTLFDALPLTVAGDFPRALAPDGGAGAEPEEGVAAGPGLLAREAGRGSGVVLGCEPGLSLEEMAGGAGLDGDEGPDGCGAVGKLGWRGCGGKPIMGWIWPGGGIP